MEQVEECVKKGTKINEPEKTKDKFTPLHCAAYYGSLEASLYFVLIIILAEIKY